MDNKSISESKFSFINPLRVHCFSKIYEKKQEILLYWFAVQQTLRLQNFGLFYLNFGAEFNELSLDF